MANSRQGLVAISAIPYYGQIGHALWMKTPAHASKSLVTVKSRSAKHGKFPNRLEELMLSREYTLEELGKIVGKGPDVIWKYAKWQRKLPFDIAKALAPHLMCSPAYLLMLEDMNLDQRERGLVDMFRGLEEDGKATVYKVADSMAKSTTLKPTNDGRS